MSIDWGVLGIFAFGIVLGVAALPWRHEMSNPNSPWMFVAGVACLWPLLLPFFVLLAFQAYRKKWWVYLDQCQSLKHSKRQKRNDF